MKKLKQFPLIILSLLLTVITSCNDEPVDADLLNIDNELIANFQVDIDNITYRAEVNFANINNGKITISGFKSSTNGEVVTLEVAGQTEGTYALGKEEKGAISTAYYLQPGPSGNIKWETAKGKESQGSVSIDKIDLENETISGRFRFTGTAADGAKKEFENGIFENIPLKGVIPGGSGSEKKFTAKVDGKDFKPTIIAAENIKTGVIDGIKIEGIIDTEKISLFFLEDVGVGAGTFLTDGIALPRALYSIGVDGMHTGSGDYVIEIHDTKTKRLKGSFSFVGAKDGKEVKVTSGSFDVIYK